MQTRNAHVFNALNRKIFELSNRLLLLANHSNFILVLPSRTCNLNFERTQDHCAKNVQIRSFFWFVFSSIQSKYGKIRTRKNSVFGQFLRSECVLVLYTFNLFNFYTEITIICE